MMTSFTDGAGSAGAVVSPTVGAGDGSVGLDSAGVLLMRRSHCELDPENAARVPEAVGVGGSGSGAISGGLNGAICSGAFAGVVRSDALAPAEVVKRVPQLLHASAVCGFISPQIGQRSSAEG